MSMSAADRDRLIKNYADGPRRLREALAKAPEVSRKWRPGPDKWSIHEIVCHCADAEANAYARIRYVLAEKEPTIIAYDQEVWARTFDYLNHPLDLALLTVDAVRANTAALLRRLPAEAWAREGTHTESGRYTADGWLTIYSEHVEKHSQQIERTLAAWQVAHPA
jgi:DinB superfamily